MKNLSKILILIIGVLLPFSAKAKVDLIAFKSHEAPKKPYQSVIIQIDKKSLRSKVELENAALKIFSKLSSSNFTTETQMFAPVREYSPQERVEILEKNHIQAILQVSLKKFEVKKHSTTLPKYTYNKDAKPGESKIIASEKDGTNIEVDQFTTRYQIDLLDLETGQVVWMAEVDSSYDSLTKKWTYRSMMKKAAKKLLEDELIAAR